MNEELPSIDPNEITDLRSALGLISQFQVLITAMTGLIKELRESMSAKEAEIAELRSLVYPFA